MSFLIEQCTFYELTEDVLATCQPFSCGNTDLDDFLFGTLRNNAYLCGVKKRKEEMSKQEKEEKAKEFWEYYEATQGTITITDTTVLD